MPERPTDHIAGSDGGVEKKPTPRYFAVDSAAHPALQQRGRDLLDTLVGGTVARTRGFTFFKSLAEEFGQAVITPRNRLVTSEELKAFEMSADAETDIDALLDATKRRKGSLEDFRVLTGDWSKHGIGPIRTLYFLSVLGSEDVDDADPLRIGGFPPSLHGSGEGRFSHRVLSQRIGPLALDWLAQDIFLSDALHHLGVSWLALEEAMSHAFIKNLPAPYQSLLEDDGIPAALAFALWRHDLDQWQSVERDGERVVRKADELSNILHRLRLGEDFGPWLTRLRQIAAPAAWTYLAAGALHSYGKLKPSNPTVRAVYTVLADTLAAEIGRQSLKNRPIGGAPAFTYPIFDRQAGFGSDRQPKQAGEFWMLCADLLFHLPVIRGVLDGYQPNGDRTQPTFHTANAIRLIVTRR